MWRRTIALTLAGMLAGTLLVEVALRLIEATPLWRVLPVAEVALYGPDADTGYTHRPGVRGIWTTENRAPIEINALGLRDRLDRSATKRAGVMRWAVVGDSYVEALQVPLDATFPVLAETALSARLGTDVEIVNLGLAGARPAVVVERLRRYAGALALDGAVVMISVADFLSDAPDDASEFPGYVPGPDGAAVIAHAFRDSRGYRFRTSAQGRAIYWLLDRSRIARIANSRKNVGLLAEVRGVGHAAVASRQVAGCKDDVLVRLERLWATDGQQSFAWQRLSAFLADLGKHAVARRMPVIIAMRGLPEPCGSLQERVEALHLAMAQSVRRHAIALVDFDARVRAHLPNGLSVPALGGFGSRLGRGHLNEAGHAVYAAALDQLLTPALCGRSASGACR